MITRLMGGYGLPDSLRITIGLEAELKTVLDEMTYDKLVEKDASIVANVGTMQEKLPMGIFTG